MISKTKKKKRAVDIWKISSNIHMISTFEKKKSLLYSQTGSIKKRKVQSFTVFKKRKNKSFSITIPTRRYIKTSPNLWVQQQWNRLALLKIKPRCNQKVSSNHQLISKPEKKKNSPTITPNRRYIKSMFKPSTDLNYRWKNNSLIMTRKARGVEYIQNKSKPSLGFSNRVKSSRTIITPNKSKPSLDFNNRGKKSGPIITPTPGGIKKVTHPLCGLVPLQHVIWQFATSLPSVSPRHTCQMTQSLNQITGCKVIKPLASAQSFATHTHGPPLPYATFFSAVGKLAVVAPE